MYERNSEKIELAHLTSRQHLRQMTLRISEKEEPTWTKRTKGTEEKLKLTKGTEGTEGTFPNVPHRQFTIASIDIPCMVTFSGCKIKTVVRKVLLPSNQLIWIKMSGAAVARLAKPQLRGHLRSYIKTHLSIALGLSVAAGVLWKYAVAEPRKRRYAEFYQ